MKRQVLVKNTLFSIWIFLVVSMVEYLLELFVERLLNPSASLNAIYEIISVWPLFLFLGVFFGLINALFLNILYVLKIDKGPLISNKYCILECCLVYIINISISEILDSVPNEYRFTTGGIIVSSDGSIISSNVVSLKKWFSEEYKLIYTYILLTLFYLLKRCYITIRDRQHQSMKK